MEKILTKVYDMGAQTDAEVTVAMIHGISSDATTFDGLLEFLRGKRALSKVRYVCFDLLGHGKTPADDENLDYDFDDQISALRRSIKSLELSTPLVLLGHSMGTLIVTRYADKYPGDVSGLVLCSPPIYTEKDLDNPAMKMAMRAFEDAVRAKNRDIVGTKAFQNSLRKIVLKRDNYEKFCDISVPTTIIYGEMDQIIASYNIPKLLQTNKNIKAEKTIGRHGVTQDKFVPIEHALVDLAAEVVKEDDETL
ncbi:alpha/beta hydrolase [Candidatus Saccharibacteria bacterium]|nr:alpha/beta hydrolase [Candidatus Saccharibacteria bacterium]